MTEEELDYVARCKCCGRIVAWSKANRVYGELARWLKLGLSVERMTTEAVKAAPWGHRCGETQRELFEPDTSRPDCARQ